MPATLDVQLRQRLLQARLDCRDFFRAVILFHRRFRALDRRFRRADVDLRRFEREIGEDRDCIGFDLNEAFADGEETFASIFQDTQLARFQSREQRHVIRINTDLAFRSWKRNHVHVFRIRDRFRGDDLEFERGSHYSLGSFFFLDHVDSALHVEVRFRHVVMFALEDFFKSANRFRNGDVLAFRAGKHFGD
jgi:hypothetical protein